MFYVVSFNPWVIFICVVWLPIHYFSRFYEGKVNLAFLVEAVLLEEQFHENLEIHTKKNAFFSITKFLNRLTEYNPIKY